MIVLAHLFRVIGSIFGIISDRSNDKEKIFLYNGLCNLFCGIQYLFLNAMTGALSSFIAILRNVLFYKHKNKLPLYVLIIYFIILIALNYLSITSFLTFIPVLLVMMYSTALYIGNVLIIKLTVIITCLLEIIYDYHVGAYIGIFFCILDIILVTISIIKKKRTN